MTTSTKERRSASGITRDAGWNLLITVLLEAQHQYNDATKKPFHQAREREYREGGSYRGGDVIIFELPKTTTGEALIIIIIIIIIIILLLLLPPPSSLLPLGVCLLVGGCYFPLPSMK
jgi:hypothetical protein